jgi:hypothetical protein
MSVVAEPTMVGLSERTHGLLKRLKEDGHFAEMVDAYRFGVALALAYGVVPDELPVPRTTIFSVATIDPDRDLGTAVRALLDTQDGPVYRWLERLAEWGVTELARQAESGSIDFAKLIGDTR